MPANAEVTQAPAKGQAFAILVENPTYRWFFAGQGASLIGPSGSSTRSRPCPACSSASSRASWRTGSRPA